MLKTQQNNKKFYKNKYLVVVLVLLLLSVLTYIGWSYAQHQQDQKDLKQNLDESGLRLDALANEIKNAGIATPTRSSYCYKAARKSGPEPIYCTQSIKVMRSDISSDTVNNEIRVIEELLTSNTSLPFDKQPGNANDPIYFVASTKQLPVGCSSIIFGRFIPIDDKSNGRYELTVECLAGDFDEFIYPEM
jgi:hypothetical protein